MSFVDLGRQVLRRSNSSPEQFKMILFYSTHQRHAALGRARINRKDGLIGHINILFGK